MSEPSLLRQTRNIWDRNVRAARSVYLGALHALAANRCAETERSVALARSDLVAAVNEMERDKRAAEYASLALKSPKRA